MAPVQLTVFARSDVGRVRANNEDAFTVTDLDTGDRLDGATAPSRLDVQQRGILLLVSDGMGGHAAGEVASALVVDSLRKSLGESGAETSSMQRLVDNAVRRANADVWEAAKATRKQGMGATLTAVLVHQTVAYVAAVGDSRAYLMRSGRIRQITKDQSFVQMLVDAGAITPEEAKNSPQKNIILQSMGREKNVTVSIGRLSLRRGDRLLVCSDGLSNLVNDDELADFLNRPDVSAAANGMIEMANERGGDDNVTAIVAELDGEGLKLPSSAERVTQTLEVLQEYGKIERSPKPPSEPAPAPPSKAPPPATPPNAAATQDASRPAWIYAVIAMLVLAVVAVIVRTLVLR